MKLSEAMMLGGTVNKLNSGCWDHCLLGVSVAALGAQNNSFNHEAESRWPWINEYFEIPEPIKEIHPNDRYLKAVSIISYMAALVEMGRMTLEQAVDWVRYVEPQESVTSSADEGSLGLKGLNDKESLSAKNLGPSADSPYSVSEHAFEHSEHAMGRGNVNG